MSLRDSLLATVETALAAAGRAAEADQQADQQADRGHYQAVAAEIIAQLDGVIAGLRQAVAEEVGAPPAELTAAARGVAIVQQLQEVIRRFASDPRSQLVYHFPTNGVDWNRVLGGKRHRSTVTATRADAAVKLFVETPRGAQLEFNCTPRVRSTGADLDPAGELRPESVLRMIGAVTGPQVSRMLHVAFALAETDARADGRAADGRFWFNPTRVADLLGYSRQSNGKASLTRISKDAIRQVRADFETCANVVIRQRVTSGGTTHEVTGTLFYPTRKEYSRRTPGQRGRDARVEWRIRDELWQMMRRNHVTMPITVLNSGEETPDRWAPRLRVYEVLAGYARMNARQTAVGAPWFLTDAYLVESCNLSPEKQVKARPDRAVAEIHRCIRALAARGFLVGVTFDVGKEGKPGVHYALPAAAHEALASVHERHQLLAGSSPKKGRRGVSRKRRTPT